MNSLVIIDLGRCLHSIQDKFFYPAEASGYPCVNNRDSFRVSSAQEAENMTMELNEAIQPVLEKYKNVWSERIRQEVNDVNQG